MSEPSPRDPFLILGLPARYRVDAQELRRAWMRRVAQVHPDAAGSALESTYANDAFRVLSDPIGRAQALLGRLGAPSGDDRAMPQEFLLEMMELREEADAAQGDIPSTVALRAEANRRRGDAIERIASVFDAASDGSISPDAAQAVRTELNVVRAFDRMLEQLEREAGGG